MATFFNRLIPARYAEAAEPDRIEAARTSAYRLRPLPNEDVYLYVKRFDNSRVVQEADPADSGMCVRRMVIACAVFVLVVGVLLPGAYGLIAGYQIHSLQAEQQRLRNEFATVDAEEARLLSPERIERLAEMQQFIEPKPESVHYLQPKSDQAVALNHGGQAGEQSK